MTPYTLGEEARHMHVTRNECAAMRLLYKDDRYSQASIAFMFEYSEATVAAHLNAECRHNE